MDDILLAGAAPFEVLKCSQELNHRLSSLGLQIAPNKIQLKDPYYYLGFEQNSNKITTQKIQLKTSHLQTLNDFQKFLGDINWLRPYLKLTTELKPLFDTLQGDSNPLSPRQLSPDAGKTLHIIETAIQQQQITFISYNKPFMFIICPTPHTPTGVLWQDNPLLWIHLPSSPSKVLTTYSLLVTKLIKLGREKSRLYFGRDPDQLILPYTKEQINWLSQNEDDWIISLSSFQGNIDNHYPSHKLLQFTRLHPFIFPKVTSITPLKEASLVFSDGSSSGIAAYVIDSQCYSTKSPFQSAQLVELFAILQIF